MKSEKKKCFDRCEELWKEIIKKRARYKSELSGQKGKQIGGDVILHAHHIARKPNYALRFSTKNGICLTAYEHKRGIHGEREEEYREKIKAVKGQDIYDQMNLLRHRNSPDIFIIEQELLAELDKLSE